MKNTLYWLCWCLHSVYICQDSSHCSFRLGEFYASIKLIINQSKLDRIILMLKILQYLPISTYNEILSLPWLIMLHMTWFLHTSPASSHHSPPLLCFLPCHAVLGDRRTRQAYSRTGAFTCGVPSAWVSPPPRVDSSLLPGLYLMVSTSKGPFLNILFIIPPPSSSLSFFCLISSQDLSSVTLFSSPTRFLFTFELSPWR